MNYQSAKTFILKELDELSPALTYHGKHHTLDVLSVAESLCVAESIPYFETVLTLCDIVSYNPRTPSFCS